MMKSTKSLAFFFLFNILFFTTVKGCGESPCHKPKHKHKPTPIPYPGHTIPYPGPGTGWPTPVQYPGPGTGGPPSTGTGPYGSCPRDALKLGVCAKVLDSLLNVTLGTPPVKPCCSLIQGLADLEAAACLCTAIKANILGIHLNVPLSLSLLLNVCGCKVPKDFNATKIN